MKNVYKYWRMQRTKQLFFRALDFETIQKSHYVEYFFAILLFVEQNRKQLNHLIINCSELRRLVSFSLFFVEIQNFLVNISKIKKNLFSLHLSSLVNHPDSKVSLIYIS